jgi:hypothetical protein
VEPSDVMIAQRVPGSAPVVRAIAEALPFDCTDGFGAAYWRRSRAYLDPAVRASISGFARLPADVVTSALERLVADLDSGQWARRNRELLDLTGLDCGYRLVGNE